MSFAEKFVDLHIHSTMSDGSYTPDELVNMAFCEGISTIAVTDHNTFEAVEDAVYFGNKKGVEVIPAAEITADCPLPWGMHLLCYFEDDRYLKIQNFLYELRNNNVLSRIEGLILNLHRNNMQINEKEFFKSVKGGNISYYTLFDYIAKNFGFSDSFEVEKKLFSIGSPCYEEGLNLPLEIISVVKEHGGKIFLAHPFKYGLAQSEVFPFVEKCAKMGVDGLEVFHAEASDEEIKLSFEFAEKLNLLISGGSDFHGDIKPSVKLGHLKNGKKIPYTLLRGF